MVASSLPLVALFAAYSNCFFFFLAEEAEAFSTAAPRTRAFFFFGTSEKKKKTILSAKNPGAEEESPPSSPSWTVTDNWDGLSSENPGGAAASSASAGASLTDGGDFFNRDAAGRVACRMDQAAYAEAKRREAETGPPSREQLWLEDQIDHIFAEGDDEGESTGVVPSKGDTAAEDDFFDEEEMGTELSLLIRCNDRPEMLLTSQGRALPPLTDDDRYDVSQLVDADFRATPFFSEAIESIFGRHAKKAAVSKRSEQGGATTVTADDDEQQQEQEQLVLDPAGVSKWLQQSLGKDETSLIGPHDGRVSSLISKYGTYGSGYVTLEGFRKLYVDAVVGDATPSPKQKKAAAPLKRLKHQRASSIRDVWRDLENHGIRSPAEVERERLLKEMAQETLGGGGGGAMIMDECEIVDEAYLVPAAKSHGHGAAKSSHERVELAEDGETPLWMKDGQFVFIDEESCIGCTQCVLAAPASFTMNEYDGRARAFSQRNSPDVAAAVASCPADCMHYVAFRELKELESARDNGDGRDDHRHFGTSTERGYINHIPLHVAGRDSDANHRSSWYHYLKNKCYKSKQCPQRGCYDCPMYQSNPESNPHFQKRLDAATHVRAKHFIDHGMANEYRKAADL